MRIRKATQGEESTAPSF